MRRFFIQYIAMDKRPKKLFFDHKATFLAAFYLLKLANEQILATGSIDFKVYPGHEVNDVSEDTLTQTIY